MIYKILKYLFIIFILIKANPTFASECTAFLTSIYSSDYKQPVTIISKKEFTDKYEQHLNNQYISSVVYGNGYFALKGKKRIKINYICTFENYSKPFWV